jgi:hypothetical protein
MLTYPVKRCQLLLKGDNVYTSHAVKITFTGHIGYTATLFAEVGTPRTTPADAVRAIAERLQHQFIKLQLDAK